MTDSLLLFMQDIHTSLSIVLSVMWATMGMPIQKTSSWLMPISRVFLLLICLLWPIVMIGGLLLAKTQGWPWSLFWVTTSIGLSLLIWLIMIVRTCFLFVAFFGVPRRFYATLNTANIILYLGSLLLLVALIILMCIRPLHWHEILGRDILWA